MKTIYTEVIVSPLDPSNFSTLEDLIKEGWRINTIETVDCGMMKFNMCR